MGGLEIAAEFIQEVGGKAKGAVGDIFKAAKDIFDEF